MHALSNIRNQFELVRDLRNIEKLPYDVGRLDDQETLKARQLLGKLYRHKGYVKPEALGEDGVLINDPAHEHSTYFGVIDTGNPSELEAAARIIHPDPSQKNYGLQVHLERWPAQAREEFLALDPPNRIGELSGMVKRPGARTSAVFFVIREMLRFSKEHDIDKWIFSLNEGSRPIMISYFGPGMRVIEEHSQSADFDADCTTYLLDVNEAYEHLQKPSRGGLAFMIGRMTLANFFAFPEQARTHSPLIVPPPTTHLIDPTT